MKSRDIRKTMTARRGGRRKHAFVAVILLLSSLPLSLEILSRGEKLPALPLAESIDVPVIGAPVTAVVNWFRASDGSVQELRPLAALPTTWNGKWFDFDKNYSKFERWFSDNLALRSLFIRFKNEIDYVLFRSSSRVYYGAGQDIYGRHQVDVELPGTERLMSSAQKVDSIADGVARLNDRLKQEGITPVWVVPMMKQYFFPGRLPSYAPHLSSPSNFQSFYAKLKSERDINFVDVYEILDKAKSQYPIFYQQDFHWTDIAAAVVSRETVATVAKLADAETRWDHPIDVSYEAFIGSEARFSARLGDEGIVEPKLKKTWTDRHVTTELDAGRTGLEFETDYLADNKLLPATCLYGNSYSDGIVRSGFPDYFQKLTKLDRRLPLSKIPEVAKGRCKFVVIQVLDISTELWAAIAR